MDLSIWDMATVITKLVIYFGFAQAVAILFLAILCRFDSKLLNHLKKTAFGFLTGALLASILYFFIQVGDFSDSGFSGAFDTLFIQLIWQSGVGEMTMWRVIAAMLALINLALIYGHINKPRQWLMPAIFFTYVISLLLIGLSFSAAGHVIELSGLARFAIALHVLMALAWIGSLGPLIIIVQIDRQQMVVNILHRFGQLAVLMVVLLVTAGSYLAYNLITDLNALLHSNYGQLLLIKLLFVIVMLLFAVYHKFILVPKLLKTNQVRQRLTHSIQAEMVIGVLILFMTAILSSLIGPTSH